MKSTSNIFIPLQHQKNVFQKLKNKRGILLYWSLGSGKTCGAIITSDMLLSESLKYHNVIVFTPGSLRQNFIREYCDVCGKNTINFSKYIFLTYNSNNIRKKLKSVQLNNSIIIVDEVHNIINGRRNESPIFVAIYNAIKKAKNCKVILISGTPLVTSVYEIRLLMEMIEPNLLPNSEKDFKKLLSDHIKLYDKIKDYVYYYQNSEQLKYYPKIIRCPDVSCILTPEQSDQYIDALKIEKKSKYYKENDKLKPNYVSIMYLLSRSIGNVAFCKKYSFNNITKYSSKIPELLDSICSNPTKHVVYSFFAEKTIHIVATLFDELNISYGIFDGSLNDRQRKNVLENYNSASNINGKKMQVLLLTTAGLEGISLKNVRFLHIVEPLDSIIKEQQLIGRVSRYKSHEELSPSNQNVKVIRYVTHLDSIHYGTNISTDQMIIIKANSRYKDIISFLKLFQNT